MALSAVNRINGFGLVNGANHAVKFQPQTFAKNTFNNYQATPNTPEHRDVANAALLGDDVKGGKLYILA